MTKILSYIGISVLVVTAIVLGYTIINIQQSPNQQSITPQVPTNNSTTTAPTTKQLTADEIAVLNVPGPNATEKEKSDHNALINKLAQSGTELIINTGCSPNPVVLRISKGAKITIKNLDSVSNTIWVDEKYNYNILAGGTTSITADFGKGGGTYGYSCGSPQLIGYFQLVP